MYPIELTEEQEREIEKRKRRNTHEYKRSDSGTAHYFR